MTLYGSRKGLQVLRNEEEMARRLAKSLDPEQRELAFGPIPDFFNETVGGLVTGNSPKIERGEPHGIPVSKLTPLQREMLMELVREYALRHRRKLAEHDLAEIAREGIEKIHFAWGGSLEPGGPFVSTTSSATPVSTTLPFSASRTRRGRGAGGSRASTSP